MRLSATLGPAVRAAHVQKGGEFRPTPTGFALPLSPPLGCALPFRSGASRSSSPAMPTSVKTALPPSVGQRGSHPMRACGGPPAGIPCFRKQGKRATRTGN